MSANRIIQELVSNHEFRCLVIETYPQGAKVLDGFVNGDTGIASAAVSGLRMWVWSTEEMAALMDWLRTYASTTHNRIRIDGMDSYNVRAAARPARDVVAALATKPAEQSFMQANAWLNSPKPPADFDARPVLSEWLEVINTAVGDRDLAAQHAGLRDARRWIRLALAGLEAETLDDAASGGVRDLAMAEAVSNLVEWEPECSKAIVLAHNIHVALKSYGAQVREPMGAHLRRQWGSQYAAWGSAFTEGQFLGTDVMKDEVIPFDVKAAPSESLDGMLGRTSAQALALDFRVLQDATLAKDWFNAPQKSRSIGGGYIGADPMAAFARPVLAETFDGLVWHRKTEVSRLIKQ